MTNMWLGVEVTELCDQHLLGLHKELHQEAGTIKNHPHGEAIARGHWLRGQIDTLDITQRHAEVAREIEKRGMNHDSPLSMEPVLDMMMYPVDMKEFNRKKLSERCSDCQI